jgi:hypothetical protein
MQRQQHRWPFVYPQRRIRGQFQSACQKRGLLHAEVSCNYGNDKNETIPWTSKVFPDFAFTHSPLTYATSVFNRDGSLSLGTLCGIVEAGRMYKIGKLNAWKRDREKVREAEAAAVLRRGFMVKT